MKTHGRKTAVAGIVIALSILWLTFSGIPETPNSYIVQADAATSVSALVEAAEERALWSRYGL